jgi:hypothetical protein
MTIIQLTPDQLREIIREELQASKEQDPIITRKEAAKLLKKSVQTIKRMHDKGEITPIHPYGRPVYYKSEILKKRR